MHLQYWYQQNYVPEKADYKSEKARVISCDSVWKENYKRNWENLEEGIGKGNSTEQRWKTSSNFVDQESKLQTAYKNHPAIKVVMEMKNKAEF